MAWKIHGKGQWLWVGSQNRQVYCLFKPMLFKGQLSGLRLENEPDWSLWGPNPALVHLPHPAHSHSHWGRGWTIGGNLFPSVFIARIWSEDLWVWMKTHLSEFPLVASCPSLWAPCHANLSGHHSHTWQMLFPGWELILWESRGIYECPSYPEILLTLWRMF